jgi:hypothetical protein
MYYFLKQQHNKLNHRTKGIQMRRLIRFVAIPLFLCITGCESHLVFIEEDHLGLKAQFQPNNPSPGEISLGYRRGIIAVVPQQSAKPVTLMNPISVTWTTNNSLTVCQNPNELMSLYTVFKANVGFGSPTEIHHFLATGMAANALLANSDSLRNVTTNLNGFTQ